MPENTELCRRSAQAPRRKTRSPADAGEKKAEKASQYIRDETATESAPRRSISPSAPKAVRQRPKAPGGETGKGRPAESADETSAQEKRAARPTIRPAQN